MGSKNEKKQWKYTWILSYSFLSPSCKIKQKELQQKLFTWIFPFLSCHRVVKLNKRNYNNKKYSQVYVLVFKLSRSEYDSPYLGKCKFLEPWFRNIGLSAPAEYRRIKYCNEFITRYTTIIYIIC